MRKTTEAERRRYVEECRNSGKPRRTWCKENGIPYTTFANWAKNIHLHEQSETAQIVQWADVTPRTAIAGCHEGENGNLAPSKIRLVAGCFEINVDQGFDTDVLTSVLRVVSRIVCC